MAPQPTPVMRRPSASNLFLLPNFFSTTPCFLYPLYLVKPNCITLTRCKTHPFKCRPISLIPIISKKSIIIESIITVDHILPFIQRPHTDHQFGFWRSYFTLGMLILLSPQWMEALNVRHEIRTISWDISELLIHLAPCPVLHTLCRMKFLHPRPAPLIAYWLCLLSKPMCGSQWNHFISSPCQGWSVPGHCSGPSPIPKLHQQSRRLWKILSFSLYW